jgi:hypothetical protein
VDHLLDVVVVDLGQVLDVVILEEHFGLAQRPAVQFETRQQQTTRLTVGHHALLVVEAQEAVAFAWWAELKLI